MIYEVIIDRSSTHITVTADSPEEAKQLGFDLFNSDQDTRDNFDYWVGDVVEEETGATFPELRF